MNTAIDLFLAKEMCNFNLRISPRLSLEDRVKQYVRLMVERNKYDFNENDIELLSSLIFLRYSENTCSGDNRWVNEIFAEQKAYVPRMVTRSMAQKQRL